MMNVTIPLFPLSAVLLPHGRMPLQIFEPRYLDLVSECLKTDTGFGVVWLSQGSEVLTKPTQNSVNGTYANIGTYAKIVDWDKLSNGLLGITVEGEKKFRLLSSQKKANHQHVADIEWIVDEPPVPLPEETQELQDLLEQLLQHPHVARLKLNSHIDNVNHLVCLLTQLLPIDEQIKFELLTLTDSLTRLEKLTTLLNNLSG